MYPGEMVWDLKPDGGGPPVQIQVAHAREAVARDPKRYSITPPEAPSAAAAKPEQPKPLTDGEAAKVEEQT